MTSGSDTVRVLFCCTGVGIFNRGIETFFRDAFDGLKDAKGIEARLVKGAESGECRARSRQQDTALDAQPASLNSRGSERVVSCLKRTGKLAPLIGKLTGRSAYAVEQWSSFPGVMREIRRFRPHVVFTSEANLMFLLRRLRKRIDVPFRILYSNGGPVHPPFNRHDVVHQVAPFYRDEALAAGEPAAKHLLVPYGIHVPPEPVTDPAAKRALRQRLGLPLDRPVILSVGWIAKQHKRMDYVVREVARTVEMLRTEDGGQRSQTSTHRNIKAPFLQLIGAMDENSLEIIELGLHKLGAGSFGAGSVRPEQVTDYYRAADIFVLGSLKEGFGRVYLEALMHGLPTIGHRHPVIRYVLGDAGIVADLSKPGALADALRRELGAMTKEQGVPGSTLHAQPLAQLRWQSVRDRFSWDILRPQYMEMLRAAAAAPIEW